RAGNGLACSLLHISNNLCEGRLQWLPLRQIELHPGHCQELREIFMYLHRQPLALTLLLGLTQRLLGLLTSGDIVEAIDRSCDVSSFVGQRSNIYDDDHPRAIGPLNMHFPVMNPRYFATEHVAHGTLLVRHITAVWAVQFERTAEPFIGIPRRRFATPEFRC